MKVFRGAKPAHSWAQKSVICLGNFDGLHLGHQALLEKVKKIARQSQAQSLVYTFDPHPKQVLRPELGHKPLFSRSDLESQLNVRGADALILEPFTKQFSEVGAEQFIRDYLLPLKPIEVVIGHDFRFGHSREGSVAILESMGLQHSFKVTIVPAVQYEGRAISSSWVRELLAEGAVEKVQKLLGRAYQVDGVVQSGAGRGHQLGIPTANLGLRGRQSPRRGVYITEFEALGSLWPSITNVGVAPTFRDQLLEEVVETHVIDQTMNLRDQPVAVRFRAFLRAERKFNGKDELVAQIHSDIAQARHYFQGQR